MPAILSRGAVAKQFIKLLKLLNNPLGNGVTVAQQTLTLFVLVRIQVPQPAAAASILTDPVRQFGCEIGHALQPQTEPGAGGRLVHCPFHAAPYFAHSAGQTPCASTLFIIVRSAVRSQPQT